MSLLISDSKRLTVDDVLQHIGANLNLSSETEWELLEEIRAHLEDAVEAARVSDKDEQTALLKAAEAFGLEESSTELQKIHGEWEISQVLLMCIAPIFCTVVLRWLMFAADGTTDGWQTLFSRPVTITIALAVLLLPLSQMRHWPYAAFGWLIFWGISIIFVAFPALRIW